MVFRKRFACLRTWAEKRLLSLHNPRQVIASKPRLLSQTPGNPPTGQQRRIKPRSTSHISLHTVIAILNDVTVFQKQLIEQAVEHVEPSSL
jgi:hypothetical protein